ncbi:MAG: helix-hairpin-helix domain-containing protein [Nitrospirae bacterium]|nr:helix-hairpin-helix domain-containing protein [Nitrospirota bacterium]
MLRSLWMKAAMLAATVAVVMWFGWPTQDASDPDSPSQVPQAQAQPESSAIPEDESLSTETVSGEQSTRSQQPGRARALSRLDLNRATVEQLQALPGIGEVLAQRIVERRQARGSFRTVDELRDVKGIGAKKLERLRPLVTVSTPAKASGASSKDKGKDKEVL